jgi:hypothetical protein
MEDEYQRTLKGKVKILYQLEKWQDVIKLCEQYNEKYGKDVEIDMMRFKCERHLQKIPPAADGKARAADAPVPPAARPGRGSEPVPEHKDDGEEEPLLLLTEDHQAVQNQGVIVSHEVPAPGRPEPVAEIGEDEPFSPSNELIITDPFAEPKPKPTPDLDHAPYEPYFDADELVISETAADELPVFSLASDDPPVIAVEGGSARNVQAPAPPPEEEMAIIDDSPGESAPTKIAFDFDSNPAVAFDVEPELAPAPAPPKVDPAVTVPQKVMAAPAEPEAPEAVIIERPAEVWHPAETFQAEEKAVEKTRPLDEADKNHIRTPEMRKRIAFNFKYVLLLVLPLAAAAVLWLALSGKLNLTGGGDDEAVVTPVTAAPSAAQRPAVKVKPPLGQEPAAKAAPTTAVPQVDESEKLVNEKIRQASDLLKKNDVIRALAVVLEAKRIKVTEPLRQLEERITSRIREDESKAAEQRLTEQNMVQSEEQAYDKALAEDTAAAWEDFLQRYPQGERASRARNRIIALERKAAQMVEQEFQKKIVQAQKLRLRSGYLSLNQADVNAVIRQLGKPAVRFETVEHGGTQVIVDFSCGLMWTLWNKPMAFDKAKWWANRIYAGYSGWRLPSIDEAMTLLQMDRALYANLPDFIVWTGDSVSDQVRSIWALHLPQGQLLAQGYEQMGYVWAVRKAGK